MRRFIPAVAMLTMASQTFAQPTADRSNAAPSDAVCLTAVYLVIELNAAKQMHSSEQTVEMARDGFRYYSGVLANHVDDSALKTTLSQAVENPDLDVGKTAVECIRRMGARLVITEDAMKGAIAAASGPRK